MQSANIGTIRVWIRQGLLVVDTIPPMRRRGSSDGHIIASSVEKIYTITRLKEQLYRVNFQTQELNEQAIWLLAKGGVICSYSDVTFHKLIQLDE